jgi:hypothetical protein
LRRSDELAALGAVSEHATVAGSAHWSGFYWSARRTYMEFFGAAALPDSTRLGDCGIGLAVERRGGVGAVAERLHAVFGDRVVIDTQVRTTPTGDIPWYTSTHLNEPQSTALWVFELDPGYLAARHPGAPVRAPLSREQDRSWDYRPDQTLDDVVGLTVALATDQSAELAAELGGVGWSVHQTGAGFLAVGPDVEIRIVPAGARSGIQQVDLRLRRAVPAHTIHLGTAELRLAGTAGQLVLWTQQ